MKRGHADLPLHYGTVPPWLASRMALLGGAITEAIVTEYGRSEFLRRISDPFWFQSLGCVLGMDWHSSGITTSVMNALKKSVNAKAAELGIYICGGRGKSSRQTPAELISVAERTGLDGGALVHNSKLSAKVDNTAVQDGFQLYLHSFIVTVDGQWAVIQQGMNPDSRMARRYHWLSSALTSFTEEPHTAVCGKNRGPILNLTDKLAAPTKAALVELARCDPSVVMKEASLILPRRHEVRSQDVNLRRLGAALRLAREKGDAGNAPHHHHEGLRPRILQSLTLVSEVIHGTPTRFKDPARFSMAHGGKDGHPFPVPTKVYDQTIEIFDKSIHQARLGQKEKSEALKNLSKISAALEKNYQPRDFFEEYVQHEKNTSYRYGGKTVFGDAKKPKEDPQLKLFG